MKSDRRENVRWTLMNRRWDIVLEIRLVSGVILRNGLQNVLSITRLINNWSICVSNDLYIFSFVNSLVILFYFLGRGGEMTVSIRV